MEYRVVGHEVWLFYADGGEERFAVLEGPNGAALVARLLNKNLAEIAAEKLSAEQLALDRARYEEMRAEIVRRERRERYGVKSE
jgi:hypothetical protein